MSDSIKAGDLVMIIKPAICCGGTESIGQIFISGRIVKSAIGQCPCGAIYRDTSAYDASDNTYVSVTRLKKLPPLPDDESNDTIADIDKTKEAV